MTSRTYFAKGTADAFDPPNDAPPANAFSGRNSKVARKMAPKRNVFFFVTAGDDDDEGRRGKNDLIRFQVLCRFDTDAIRIVDSKCSSVAVKCNCDSAAGVKRTTGRILFRASLPVTKAWTAQGRSHKTIHAFLITQRIL